MSESDTKHKLHIDEAFLKGFKSIDDLHIKLNPGLNIIIGPNGSGKSNLLEFLNDAIYSMFKVLEYTFKSAELILKSTNGDTITYQIERTIKNKSRVFDSDDSFIEPYHQSLLINNEIAYSDNESGISHFRYIDETIAASRSIPMTLLRIRQRFLSPDYIQYSLPKNLLGIENPISITIPFNEAFPTLEYFSDSKFIANILSLFEDSLLNGIWLNAAEDGDIKWINKIKKEFVISNLHINHVVIDSLRRFTPIGDVRFNENINIFNDDKNVIIENLKLEFFVNDHWLPWSQLSDGTKRLFFIISEIAFKTLGTVILEEPEIGVHPHQFELLMQFLREQSATKQIIMSTHSPKALDILDKENLHKIFITKYEKGKGTTITSLSQQQKEKATMYMNEVGFLSDYWLLSDLEA